MRVALVTTRGFGDVLRIGYQNRPRLFDLAIRKPEPLAAMSIEIDERVAADGTVLSLPDRVEIRRQLAELRDSGIDSLAIALLHAVAHPAHEQLVAEIGRDVGFEEISVSSEVASLVKLVPRADTTTVDAYLNPVLRGYVAALRQALPESEIQILTSAGGLVAAEQFAGRDSILSGPAGGIVGFSRVAQAAGSFFVRPFSTWAERAPTFRGSTERSIWNTRPKKQAFASWLPCWPSKPWRQAADRFADSTA